MGWRGLVSRVKREAPRYAKLLPELPRLLHHQLAHGDEALRHDLRAILLEQRRTNRMLSAVIWLGIGFGLGLLVARLVLALHEHGML